MLPDHMKYTTPHVSWANDSNSRTIPFMMMEISLFAGCLDDLFCINSHEVKTQADVRIWSCFLQGCRHARVEISGTPSDTLAISTVQEPASRPFPPSLSLSSSFPHPEWETLLPLFLSSVSFRLFLSGLPFLFCFFSCPLLFIFLSCPFPCTVYSSVFTDVAIGDREPTKALPFFLSKAKTRQRTTAHID